MSQETSFSQNERVKIEHKSTETLDSARSKKSKVTDLQLLYESAHVATPYFHKNIFIKVNTSTSIGLLV